jgi:hypothetical protein
MTNHTDCLHPATSAGRAACRKAGSVSDFHWNLAIAAKNDSPCEDCFWNATDSAAQNLEEEFGVHTWGLDRDADNIRKAREYRAARSYLYDIGSLSACSAHQHLL